MNEPITVGLTMSGQDKLRQLKEDGYFSEMTDAYRFAIGLALAHEAVADVSGGRSTMFNVGSLDPDKNIYHAVKALYQPQGVPVYTIAEGLAEWGVAHLHRLAESGELSFGKILSDSTELGQS